MKYSEQINKHYIVAEGFSFTVLYRNEESAPWKVDQSAYRKHEEAEKTKEEYLKKGFKEVEIGIVIPEGKDQHRRGI